MGLSRRHFLASSATLLAASQVARADEYPSRPIHLVVGFPPGLTPDIVGRFVAQGMSDRIGQRVVVDNRPGAGSNIGTEFALKSPPDGYTLLMVTYANSTNESLYDNLNFSIIRDMAPVILTSRSPNVLVVNPSLPAKTIPELIAYAKANPGKVNYASPGFGTINNVTVELFKMMAGIDLVHVPYKGSYVPDVLAGQVPVTITPIPTAIEFIRAGKLRALGVTSAKPSDALPGVPTIGQFLPGYEADVWHGVGAPKGTPSDIVAMLNKIINDLLVDPTIKSRLANVGVDPVGGTAEEFGEFVASEVDKWSKVIHTANIKLQ